MEQSYPQETTWVRHELGETTAKTAVHLWGNPDNAPVLLLHGFMQTGLTWTEVARELAREWFVVAPDFIGHGQTEIENPDAKGAVSFEGAIQQIEAVAKELFDKRPFILGGYSLGGRVAEQLLAAHASLDPYIQIVVIESSALGPDSEEQRQSFRRSNEETIKRLQTMPFEEFVTFWENLPLFESQKRLPEEVQQAIRVGRLANNPDILVRILEGLSKSNMSNCREVLAQCKKPVLYIAGGLDAKYSAEARRLEKAFENSPAKAFGSYVQIIPDTGHNIHIEQPTLFVKALYTFLESFI